MLPLRLIETTTPELSLSDPFELKKKGPLSTPPLVGFEVSPEPVRRNWSEVPLVLKALMKAASETQNVVPSAPENLTKQPVSSANKASLLRINLIVPLKDSVVEVNFSFPEGSGGVTEVNLMEKEAAPLNRTGFGADWLPTTTVPTMPTKQWGIQI
jgi:hypothetical protein